MKNEKDEVKKLYEQGEQLRKKKQAEKLYELVERLKVEKLKVEEEYRKLGCEDGKRDAYEMQYKELVELERKLKSNAFFQYHTIVEESSVWKRLLSAKVQERDIPDDERNSYLEGWLQGVLGAWEQVKGMLN